MAAGSAGGSVGGTVGGGVTGGGITGGGVTGGGVTGGPAKTTRPILLLLDSVNQRLPSAPSVIPIGPLPGVATANSAMSPVGVKIGRAPSELQSLAYLVCRLLLEKKKKIK